MSENDDTRILNMRINNKEFLKGTGDSLKAIDTLNKGIDNAGKGQGLQNMAKSADLVKTKFGAMRIAGITAIATVTNLAVNAGLRMAKSLTVNPIMDGWREYNKLLTSTQTIMANTGGEFKKFTKAQQITAVGNALDELNQYSDQTVYNFGQMADNIGRFTAAGVKLKPAVTAIKGLANSAALAGASSEDLNRAMYQVSQALSAGTIKLMDWKSLENANLGGKNMRDSLMATAKTMKDHGRAMSASIKKHGDFRNSLTEGWLTADIFTKSMKVMAGVSRKTGETAEEMAKRGLSKAQIAILMAGKSAAYTTEQLEKMGFSKEAAKRMNEVSAAAIESASKIKTFGQLMDVTKEAIGSGWAGVFRSLFGNLEESKKIWTAVGDVVTGAVNKIFGGVQNMLTVWREAGGFNKMWMGFGNIFKALGNVLEPIGALFDAIFPGTEKSGTALVGLTNGFYGFTVVLERVTRGIGFLVPVFSALGTGIRFVIDAIKILVEKFDGPVSEMFARGTKLGKNMIDGLVDGLMASSAVTAIKDLANQLIDYFKGLLGINSPSTVFAEFGKNIVEGLVNGLLGAISLIDKAVKAIGDKLMNFDKFDFANLVSAIIGGGAIVAIFKIGKAFTAFGKIFSQLGNVLGETSNTLQSMQTGIKAKAILNIAIAVGILALSLFLLSKIPKEKLALGMLTITAMLYQLSNVMNNMAKNAATTKTAIASITAMAFAMLLMAGAVLVLSAAVLAFGLMDDKILKKGFISITVAMGLLAASAYVLGQASPYMILAAGGILIMAFALGALLPVILLFSKVDGGKIAGGMTAIGLSLLALGIAMIPLAAMGPSVLLASVALAVLAPALAAMLGVILLFEKAKFGAIMAGVGAIALTLVILGAAALVTAPAFILLGAAAVLLGAGFLAMGLGLTLAGAGLTVLVAAGTAGVAVFISAIEGFMAILPLIAIQVVAAFNTFLKALADKAPEIRKSAVRIGTEFLGGLRDMLPEIGKTITSILKTLLKTFTDNQEAIIQAGIDFMIKFLEGVSNNADRLVTAGGDAILALLDAIDKAVNFYAPQIGEKGRDIAIGLITGLISGLIPDDIEAALKKMVDDFVQSFKDRLGIKSPSTVFAGFGRDIVMGLINGIGSLIGSVGTAIGRIGSKIRDGLSQARKFVSDKMGEIRSAIGRLPGVLTGILGKVGSAAKSIGSTIVKKIGEGLKGAGSAVASVGTAVGKAVQGAINKILPIKIPAFKIPIPGFKDFNFGGKVLIPELHAFAKGVTGFGGGAALVGERGPEVVTMGRGSNVITNENLVKFMKTVAALTRKLASGGSENSSGGIVYTVDANFRGNPKASGLSFATNIAAGLINGMKQNQSAVNSAMVGVGVGATKSFADILGIKSPSTVFHQMATYVGEGFINGLLASVSGIQKAAVTMANAAVDVVSVTITDSQLKLEALQAEADAYAKAAANKKLSAATKKKLQTEADAATKRAEAQQKLVEDENAAAERARQYESADSATRADMKTEDAKTAALNASTARKTALALAKEAALIRSKDKATAASLDKKAADQLAAAKIFADTAEGLAREAADLEAKAQTESPSSSGGGPAYNQTVSAEDVARAQSIFDSYAKSLADAQEAMSRDLGPSEVTLNQYNTSPEAISPAEAYRNGKSLVAIAARKLVPTP